MSMSVLQFAPFSSTLDPGFWHKLSQLKLDVYGLDDDVKQITSYYVNGDVQGLPSRITLDYDAFESPPKIPPRSFICHGVLKNTNTIEDFKNLDKTLFLNDQGSKIWADIVNGRCIADPSLLSQFCLITYADLKKYHYYYWFAFPAVCFPERIIPVETPVPIDNRFSERQISSLLSSYDEVCLPINCGFFLLNEKSENIVVSQLTSFNSLFASSEKIVFGFSDPCTLEAHPGWSLRNYLALITYHWGTKLGETIEVLCLRDRFKDGKRSINHSIVIKVSLPAESQGLPKCVGWEKNERQKMGPRMVNLSATMDPTKLAASAVDLNLKLMRWRLLPGLDLDAIAGTRCLLLGSGTLGCNVARCLLGWGVRNITLVDNGQVSYSNPVRQTLFTFDDSLNGGKPKAEAAANSLKQIFPGVNATGISLSIPMPGHSVVDAALEQTRKDVQQLDELVQNHDAVFLLMDTRESRWLPSVLAATYGKIVINAALGFDTYLVMRHGVKLPSADTSETGSETDAAACAGAAAFQSMSLKSTIPGHKLGCYYCNDVVAPGDSTRDRALDQQCTVSRPGMSYIASALAVELLISVIVHSKRGDAPARVTTEDGETPTEEDSVLGIVPHQLRGFLSRFQQVLPASRAFDKCTACSDVVLKQYRQEGFGFLLNVFNQPRYLEDLTGLTQLHMDTADTEIWELSDDDSMDV